MIVLALRVVIWLLILLREVTILDLRPAATSMVDINNRHMEVPLISKVVMEMHHLILINSSLLMVKDLRTLVRIRKALPLVVQDTGHKVHHLQEVPVIKDNNHPMEEVIPANSRLTANNRRTAGGIITRLLFF